MPLITLASVSCVGSLIFLQQFIAWFGRVSASGVREYVPKTHLKKGATPSMGGIVWVVSTLLWYIFSGHSYSCIQYPEVLCTVLLIVTFGMTGLLDDIVKKIYKKGISARLKSSLQLLSACCIIGFYIYCLYAQKSVNYSVVSNLSVVLSLFFMPSITIVSIAFILQYLWMLFVVIGASNAVNLTDGLDGLAGGIAFIITTFLLAIAYFHTSPLVGLLAVLLGSLVAFLLFNKHPARIFMGDVGSLSLGACMGFMFLVFKAEWFFALAGILYVINTCAVMLQVYWYKRYKKRLFPMAPLHHSFELLGYSETTIVYGAWLITLVMTVCAFILFFYV